MSDHAVLVLAGGLVTSATCRCARAAGSPRRCAAPASRSTERDVDAGLLASLRADRPSCVVPMLHGETGEDGAIREILELLSIPYVGATPSASRAAFDKPVAKTVVRGPGCTPPSRSASRTRPSASSVRPT